MCLPSGSGPCIGPYECCSGMYDSTHTHCTCLTLSSYEHCFLLFLFYSTSKLSSRFMCLKDPEKEGGKVRLSKDMVKLPPSETVVSSSPSVSE